MLHFPRTHRTNINSSHIIHFTSVFVSFVKTVKVFLRQTGSWGGWDIDRMMREGNDQAADKLAIEDSIIDFLSSFAIFEEVPCYSLMQVLL